MGCNLIPAIVLLQLLTTSVLAETYYVTPSPGTQCNSDSEGVQCFTLSQYANKPEDYFDSNTTLMLLPGNHSFDSELWIRNLNQLSVRVLTKTTETQPNNVSVVCENRARFRLEFIDQVEMNGIDFIGCIDNRVTSVDNLTIEDCTFKGQGRNGTGFVLSAITSGDIVNSSFSLYAGRETTESDSEGGAVIITGDSNIFISDCLFEENQAKSGGAVYIEHSSVTLHYSTFSRNGVDTSAVSVAGGAVYAIYSSVTINNSNFTNNFVVTDNIAYGGALYSYNSKITLTNTTFMDTSVNANVLGYGGAVYSNSSNTIIRNCTFIKNSMFANAYAFGGAVCSKTGNTTEIDNSLFTDNTVYTVSQSGFGGGVFSQHDTNIAIHRSTFKNNVVNTVTGYGGAVYGSDSTMNITNSTLTNNTVISYRNGYGGGVSCELGILNLNDCTLTNNAVYGNSAYGGAVATTDTNAIVVDSRFNGNSASEGNTGNGGAFNGIRSNVTINNSTFTANSIYNVGTGYGGALNGIRSNVTIYNNIFTENVVSDANIGNGGAVDTTGGRLTINDSTFTSNAVVRNQNGYGGAIVAAQTALTIETCTFINNTATGTSYSGGGALYTHQCNATLSHTTFLENTVTADSVGYGGAIYVLSTNISSHCFLNITNNTAELSVLYAVQSTVFLSGNTTFTYNYGSLFAFSSNVTFAGLTKMLVNANRVLVNSTKEVEDGGALTCFQSDIAFTGTAYLMYNKAHRGGAILATESKIYVYGQITVAYNTATSSGGGIYAYQSELHFKGSTTSYIRHNRSGKRGGGINAVASITRLSNGSLYFIENTAERGGGMCLDLNARLYVIKQNSECTYTCDITDPDQWLRLEFISNHADYGGALFASDATNSANCAAAPQSSESECFFQSLAVHPFERVTLNVLNTYFTNNTARVSGETLYGGLLDRCTVSTFSEIFKKYYTLSTSSLNAVRYILNVTNLNITESDSSKHKVSSEPVRVCFCRNNNQPDCSYIPQDVHVKKGQRFRVPLVAVDQINNTVTSTIEAALSSTDGGLGEGQTNQQTLNTCTVLNFTAFSPHDSEQLLLNTDGPCHDIGISRNHLDIKFLPCDYCPIGFNATLSCDCLCDDVLYPDYVTECSIDEESVLRKESVWISYSNNTSGFMLFPHCPFDYCYPSAMFVDLNIENGSDVQCAFNRSGKLCGSCKNGLSLSLGSSRCTECSNNWLALLLLFAIAGIALVAFLLVFNLTVAVGTINGLIFYANMVVANRAIFFPFDTPNFLTVFIAWINLDFGFETCFTTGLDGYWKTWLQLTFPTYLIFLVAMVIVISQQSRRFARLLSNRNPVATLATLILLSYAKLQRTVIASLSYGTLLYSNSTQETVWLIDANVPYLKGKHIPMYITALLILVFGAVFSILLFSWQWLLRCPNKRALRWIRNTKFNSFMDAYCAPYTTQHRYWTGLLLLTRFLLYIVFAFNLVGDPTVNLLSIICVVGSLLFLMALLKEKVYKNWLLFLIEASYIFNIILFSASTLSVRQTADDNTVSAYISASIAFLTFLAVLIYHTYTFILAKYVKRVTKKLGVRNQSTTQVSSAEINEERNLLTQGREFTQLREPLNLIVNESLPSILEVTSRRQVARRTATHSVIDGIPMMQ